MSIQPINIGQTANDGNGESLRAGGVKINANFSELDQRLSTAQGVADSALKPSDVGVSVAALVGGVVPASQLPSFVDDVLEFASLSAFPATGEAGKIYIAINTNGQYRWTGSGYVLLVASPGTTDAVPEGAINKYWTAARTLATALAGLLLNNPVAIAATDSVLVALGKLQAQVSNRAVKGANSDITSLSGLTTALSIGQGGTGAQTAALARTGLGLKAAAVADILGTVSQSGGVPTGSIVEVVTNASGTAFKFAGGMMVCVPAAPQSLTANVALGTLFRSDQAAFAFPATFAGSPTVVPTGAATAVAPGWAMMDPLPSATGVSVRWVSTNNGSVGAVGYVAVGRWY